MHPSWLGRNTRLEYFLWIARLPAVRLKQKYPSTAFALTAYATFTLILAVVAWIWNAERLLYLLIVPIFMASIVYPRVAFLAMQLMAIVTSLAMAYMLNQNPAGPLKTIVNLSIWVLAISEILCRLKKQRERLDAILGESDQRFRALIENNTDGIVLLDGKGMVTYSSPAIKRMLGYGTHEVVGKSILSHVHEGDATPVTQQLGMLLSTPGATASVQLRRQHKSGSWVWLEATLTNLVNEPIVRAIVVNYRDITERKRAENRVAIFSRVAQDLARSTTPHDAAQVILHSAQDLFGWDAGFVHLFSTGSEEMIPILTMDFIDGQTREVHAPLVERQPSEMVQRVLKEGAQLVLRKDETDIAPRLTRIGNQARTSASLMFAPVTDGDAAVGIVSIQSYKFKAYGEEDLQTFQALARHCGGALARIREAANRLKAEEELQESETRFRTVVESLGEGLLITDLSDVVLYANTRITELCGYSRDELVGQPAFELIVPQSGWADLKEKNQRRAKGISERYELLLKRKDGTKFWAETYASPYRSPSDEIIGTIGAMIDITERKESEERTAAFLSLGHKLSGTYTPQDAARIIVETAQELFGWDACTLDLYLPDQDLIVPLVSIDTIEGERTNVPHPFAGSPPSPMMRRLVDGAAELILRGESSSDSPQLTPFGNAQRLSASLMFVPIRHRTKVIGSLSIQSYAVGAYSQEDLNALKALADHCGGTLERLRAVEDLRKSEERFSKAFRSSPVPIGITSLQNDRFLDANESLVHLLEYAREEIIGRTSSELKIWVDPDQWARHYHALKEYHSIREAPCQFRTRRGSVRDVLASAELFELGGESCVLHIIQDITDRLNLEAQLRHAQKMEAVGQLSAGVAHDFNNILTIIQGHTALLSTKSEFDAEARESMEQITVASERGSNLTGQLLAFSRKRMMQPRMLDLSEVVNNAGRMLRGLLGERIDLQFKYSGHLPSIYADIGMLDQVIVNLALNARDAMANGGKLTIGLASVEIKASYLQTNPEACAGQFVRMTVTDTGCGMDAPTLRRIFEPFFTTKDVGKGSGLGLATVYGIIKQHQGWVEVESRVGLGTTFNLYLPVGRSSSTESPSSTPAKKIQGGTETILLVEDERPLRALIKKVLETYGYKVLEAANGREALEKWAQHENHADLLLTDIVMPDVPSGIDLAKKLRIDRPRLRVIYTSGYSIDHQASSVILREGINFLSKPFNPPKLAQMVRNILDTESALE